MPDLSLTIACGPYDRMEGIRTGAVQIEGIDPTYVAIQSPPEIFARMMKTQAFDVSEMSLSSYLSNRTRGEFPFIALPVFPSRVFRHGNIFINRNAGIERPQDFQGKRVGTFGYRQTASVWIRGILADEYGVEPPSICWGVSLYKALVASKELALRDMRFSGAMRYMVPWLYDDIDEIDELFGGDPMPYGLEPNRHTLETFARYLRAQGLVDRPVGIDELFVPIVEER